MPTLYSILKLVDNRTRKFKVVVCENFADECEIIRLARNAGCQVLNVVAAEDCGEGIYFNDFPR